MGREHVNEHRALRDVAARPNRSHEWIRADADADADAGGGGFTDSGRSRRVTSWTTGPTHDIVMRSQLHARLDRIFTARAGQVTGPSGSGKTTLLRAWASTTTCCDVVWVRIDRAHRDGSVLAEDLATAVFQVVGEPVAVRGTPTDDAVDLIADVIDRSGLRVVIALDDAQALVGAESLGLVRRLLALERGCLRILIAGRGATDLVMEELLRPDEILTIGANDLQADDRETAAIIRSVSGVDIDDRVLASIHDQVGGWMAGAVLAGLALRVSDGSPAGAGSAIDRHRLFDEFFSTEVFESLPAEVQAFLLDTCVLRELEPDLCAALSQRDDVEDILWGLERGNTFTAWTGGDPPRFRYHRLLKSWLRRRLEQLDPARALELQRRAADWFEAQGRTPDAIDHRLAAGDFQLAAEMIIEYGPRALGEGRYEAIRDWIGSLPEPLRTSDVSLLVLLAEVEHRLGNNEATTALRAILRDRLTQRTDKALPEHLELTVVVQRGTELVVRGELDAAAAQARHALSMIDLGSWSIGRETLRFEDLLVAMDIVSIADKLNYVGDFSESRRVSRRLVERLPADDPRAAPVRARCLGQMAVCELIDGARFAAEDLALEAIALCQFHRQDPIDLGYAELAALVAGRQVDRVALHASLERRISQIDVPPISCLVDLLRSWSYVQTGELPRARRLLASAERTLATLGQPGMLDALARRVAAMVDLGHEEALLSEREVAVLSLLAAGYSRRSAAEHLHLSLNTIKTYARLTFRKLGVTTLEAAVERCDVFGIELVAPTEASGAVIADPPVSHRGAG